MYLIYERLNMCLCFKCVIIFHSMYLSHIHILHSFKCENNGMNVLCMEMTKCYSKLWAIFVYFILQMHMKKIFSN